MDAGKVLRKCSLDFVLTYKAISVGASYNFERRRCEQDIGKLINAAST